MNSVFKRGNVTWLNLNETKQAKKYNSPVAYEKIGLLDTIAYTNPASTPNYPKKVRLKMQAMVISKSDVLRGGKPEECQHLWIQNPVVPKRSDKKMEMFERFNNCTPKIQ